MILRIRFKSCNKRLNHLSSKGKSGKILIMNSGSLNETKLKWKTLKIFVPMPKSQEAPSLVNEVAGVTHTTITTEVANHKEVDTWEEAEGTTIAITIQDTMDRTI